MRIIYGCALYTGKYNIVGKGEGNQSPEKYKPWNKEEAGMVRKRTDEKNFVCQQDKECNNKYDIT